MRRNVHFMNRFITLYFGLPSFFAYMVKVAVDIFHIQMLVMFVLKCWSLNLCDYCNYFGDKDI